MFGYPFLKLFFILKNNENKKNMENFYFFCYEKYKETKTDDSEFR